LLKVEAIKKAPVPSLDGMRDRIVDDIKKQELLSKISSDSSKLSDLAYEHSDLAVPAEKLGLTIHTSDWFSPQQPTGFAANPKVQDALGDPSVMSQGQNSQLLDLGNNQYAVIHLADHRDAAQLPFDKVKEQVVKDVQMAQAKAHFAKLEEQAGKEKSLAAIADIWQGKQQKTDALTRNDQRLTPAVVGSVFSQPPVKSEKPFLTQDENGDIWALQITAVTPGKQPTADQQRQELASMGVAKGQMDFRAYLSWLRSTTEISINQDKLKAAN
jgi:peptidyl-prolyl cis-trans isomerase D